MCHHGNRIGKGSRGNIPKGLLVAACAWVAWQLGCPCGLAQINSWTNPASAHWQDPYWSLGVLPAGTQSVMITNAGYKAVGIFPSTPTNFPGSMTVSSLAVFAPSNGLNTLLLNYSGTAVPLTVLGQCTIGQNGRLLDLHAGLQVVGSLIVSNGGTLENDGGVVLSTNQTLIIGGTAILNVNGDCALGQCSVAFGGEINQSSGTATISNLTVEEGTYNFSNGVVTATTTTCGGLAGATFNQYGGTNSSSVSLAIGEYFGTDGSGTYTIYGGMLRTPSFGVGAGGEGTSGSFNQSGGTVNAGGLVVGSENQGTAGYYVLTNGVLACGNEELLNGPFYQYGGFHTVTNTLTLFGYFDPYGNADHFPSYELFGGNLVASSLNVESFSEVSQTGGTNSVGTLTLYQGMYYLAAGELVTSNTTLVNIGFGSTPYFFQGNGVHTVTGLLSIDNSALYVLAGGTLTAPNVQLQGTLTISNNLSASVLNNPGSFDLAGVLQISSTTQHLGTAILSGNAQIQFGPGPVLLGFNASAQANWNPAAILSITNWSGSTNGNGFDQLTFGTNAAALTLAQLRQIAFVNPSGFAPGQYSAKMLSSGEVVPAPNPPLYWQLAKGQLIISWFGQPTLQSATNVGGPYVDVSGASSPYTNNFGQFPRQFFRLRL